MIVDLTEEIKGIESVSHMVQNCTSFILIYFRKGADFELRPNDPTALVHERTICRDVAAIYDAALLTTQDVRNFGG